MENPPFNIPAIRYTQTLPRSTLNETTFFIVMVFVGLHTAISLIPDGKMLAPYVISFLAALGILSLNARRISDAVVTWFIVLSCGVFAFALLIGSEFGRFGERIPPAALFIYSMIIGYSSFVGFMGMGARRIEMTFFWVSIVLVSGAALEVYGPIQPLSDWFRETFNAWHGLYVNEARDVVHYGAYRPNFFASEPSILGTSAGLALFFWMVAKKNFDAPDILLAACLVLAGLFFIRSPPVLFAPIATFLVHIAVRQSENTAAKIFKFVIIFGFLSLIILVPAISLYATFVFRDAPDYIKGPSFFEREIAPFLMAVDILRNHLAFGIGLGNGVERSDFALKAFATAGLLGQAKEFQSTDIGILIGNVFWEFWFCFGAVGGGLMILFLSRLRKILAIPVSVGTLFCIAGGTYWQGFGGVNTPLTWFVFFGIAALCCLRKAELQCENSQPSARYQRKVIHDQ